MGNRGSKLDSIFNKINVLKKLSSHERAFSTSTCLRFVEIVYKNVDKEKLKILKDNQNKSGIYMFQNLLNEKKYIGSSENLRARFMRYFNKNYLLRNTSMYICRSLHLHGYGNFSLTILEYCEPEKCLERENTILIYQDQSTIL